MRIVHLGKYYPPAPGGIETHVQTLAKAQAELGAKVTVLCVNHKFRDDASARFPALRATPTVIGRTARYNLRGSVVAPPWRASTCAPA